MMESPPLRYLAIVVVMYRTTASSPIKDKIIWQHHDESGKKYLIARHETFSFEQARAFCERWKSYIVEPKTKKLNDILANFANEYLSEASPIGQVWIGLEKSNTTSDLVWIRNRDPLEKWSNWHDKHHIDWSEFKSAYLLDSVWYGVKYDYTESWVICEQDLTDMPDLTLGRVQSEEKATTSGPPVWQYVVAAILSLLVICNLMMSFFNYNVTRKLLKTITDSKLEHISRTSFLPWRKSVAMKFAEKTSKPTSKHSSRKNSLAVRATRADSVSSSGRQGQSDRLMSKRQSLADSLSQRQYMGSARRQSQNVRTQHKPPTSSQRPQSKDVKVQTKETLNVSDSDRSISWTEVINNIEK